MRNQCPSSSVCMCVCTRVHTSFLVDCGALAIYPCASLCVWRLSPYRAVFTPPLVSVTASPKLQRWNGENLPPKRSQAAGTDCHRATSFFLPRQENSRNTQCIHASVRQVCLSVAPERSSRSVLTSMLLLNPTRSKSVGDCRSLQIILPGCRFSRVYVFYFGVLEQ